MQAVMPSGNEEASERVLAKAVVRAAGHLQLSQANVAQVLGISGASVSRLFGGTYVLSRSRGKEWELSLLLVRLFRSLDAILGHGEQAQQWLRNHNHALNAAPADLIQSSEGLVRVVQYLDAHRGRV